MKKSKEPCVLKEDVQDAVNFVNNVKTALKVVTVITMIVLAAWGFIRVVEHYNDNLRKDGAMGIKHRAWMCLLAVASFEEHKRIHTSFSKEDKSKFTDIRLGQEIFRADSNATFKCIREL